MKSFRNLVLPLLLALVIGSSAYAEDPMAELTMGPTLPPGVYWAYYLGNPSAPYPCAYVPSSSCLIIVISAAGQNLNAVDNTVGPVATLAPSTNPAWKWQAVTTQESTMYMDPNPSHPPTGD